MRFRVKISESTGRALRRVCRESVGHARKQLRENRPSAIHAVRKDIKKVRAALRLVKTETGRDANRKAAKSLRKAADRLAAPRDARVMLRAFENLVQDGGPRFSKLHQMLQKHSRREARRFRAEAAMNEAAHLLRKAKRKFARLKVPTDGWATFEPGLIRSYARGRELFEKARKKLDSETLHEWRKHVKNFWHQLQLLCPAWPADTGAFVDRLEQLGGLLGEEHDLCLLKQFIARDEAVPGTDTLNRLINARRKKLRASALKLGAGVYAHPAKSVCANLGRQWNQWRQQPR